ncbi:MAG: Hsp20/alpha crystallin family protein [Marinifilaceae bacterium]
MRLMKCNNRSERPAVLFSDWMGRFIENDFFAEGALNLPSVNVSEEKNWVKLEFALPGWKKEDIHVGVDGDYLVVQSEKTHEEKSENEGYLRREFYAGAFKRSFYLNDSLEKDRIEASFENGVLQLIVPRKEKDEDAARKIEIH